MRQQQRTVPPDPYRKVREAALLRDQADTSRTWALADAILAMIPAEPSGQRNDLGASGHQGPVPDRLAELSDRLYEDGVVQPNGGSYTAMSLGQLRKTAMAWPKADRHPEAAFRTAQEAGAQDGNGRKILSALCAVARGDRTQRPVGLTDSKGNEICTAIAWQEAVAAIGKRKGKAYAVSANDLRRCLERKPNVPAPDLVDDDDDDEALGSSDSGSDSTRTEAEEAAANDGAQSATEVALSAFTLFSAFTSIVNQQKGIIAALSGAQGLTTEDREALDGMHLQVLDNESVIGILLGEKPTDDDFQRLLEDSR